MTATRRTAMGVLVVLAIIFSLGLMAQAETEPFEAQDGYYTFIWDMGEASTGSGADAPWPQTLVTFAYTGGLNTQPDLGALDDEIPECGYFQIDVYKIDSVRDQDRLEAIVSAGVLNWPEDSAIYYSSKKYEVAPSECETTTTTTMPEETTTTTEQETTTTTTAPSTTSTSMIDSTTSTTVSLTSTTSLPTTSSSESEPILPFTGVETELAVPAAIAMLAAGVLTVVSARREDT